MIDINLLQVSADGKFIELDLFAPEDYIFDTLMIKKYDYIDDVTYPENQNGWVDKSSLYFKIDNREILNIPLDEFGSSTMFYVEFNVIWNGIGEELPINNIMLSEQNYIGACSNVSDIYTYLLNCLIKLKDNCLTISNDIKRTYLILDAHKEAMKLERYEDAEFFYDLIKSGFNNCNININKINNCNCNG